MAYKLPILAGAGLIAAVWAGSHFLAQNSAKNQLASSSSVAAAVQLPSAASLVQSAIARLDQRQAITAKMRMQAELLGQTMVGQGRYAQGPAASKQFRVQWILQVDEQKTSLQQVSDGRFLWIQRQFDEAPVPIAQVDLKQLPIEPDAAAPGGMAMLAAGGIARLLQSLDHCFEFTAALPTELGGVPVIAVRGDWNAQALVKLLPDQAAAIQAGQPINLKKLPLHVPDHVVVFLGRDDQFPYRVEYRRTDVGASANDPGRSLLMVEWFDCKFDQPLPRAEFKFDPGQTSVVNETSQFIERLKSWQ